MTGVGPAFLKHHEGGEEAICIDEHDSCGRYVYNNVSAFGSNKELLLISYKYRRLKHLNALYTS